MNLSHLNPEVLDAVTTKRAAIAVVRAEADALIEQAQRRAKGWDAGPWRDDLAPGQRHMDNTIRANTRRSVYMAFALSERFGGAK